MRFSFIQITDHHLPESESELVRGVSTVDAFRAVLRHIAAHAASQADFIVSTGDLVETASAAAYQTLAGLLGARPAAAAAPGPLAVSLEGLENYPFYGLPGNHDDRDWFYRGLFPAGPPASLLNAAFVHKGVQFVCLDWGPGVKAAVHPETLAFLDRALRARLPSILLMHHHFHPIGSRWLDEFIADDPGRFWQAVAGRNVLGVFCGHTHITYEKVVEGIPVFGLRSTAFPFALQDEPLTCSWPPHYRRVTVEDGAISTEIVEVPL